MGHDKTIEPPGSGKPGRRPISKVLISLGVAVLASSLVSCQEAADTTNLSVLEWSGYEKPVYHPEYNARYGGQPKYTFFAEAQDALKRMRAGYQVDVVHLCTGQMAEARAAGLIKPLDIDRIPRWGEITPELLELKDVRIDGEYWLVPWEWGYSTVGYNPEVVDVENATYAIFIDPRFKGRTALTTDVLVNIYVAGIIGGWADPFDPTEAEIEAIPEIFAKMLENARFVWTDSTQLEQAWAAGDVGISYVFGSASRRMPKEGMSIVVVEPLLTWMCGLSLSANGRASEDEAYDYINSMLDPSSGVALFDEYGYGHGNANTVDLIDPERLVGTGLDDPVALFAGGVFSSAMPPAKKARLLQLWFEAQAGLD
jgi:spermidine/putrescine-binding protein